MREHDKEQDYDGFGDGSQRVEWVEYYYAVRERLWILLLCAVIAAIGATIYLSRQRPQFQSRAVLIFERSQAKVLEKVPGAVAEETIDPEVINTVVALLESYPFAKRVAERMQLTHDPRFATELGQKAKSNLTIEDAAAILLRTVKAAPRPKTRLVDVLTSESDASMATDLANAYADEYIRYGLERRASANADANQYLIEESERLRRQMHVSEEAMQSFRERERAASPEKQQEVSEGKLDDLSKNIADTESKLFQLDTDLKAAGMAAPGDVETLLRLPSIAAEPTVATMNQALADQERQFDVLKQTYRAKHPLYIAAETQITSLSKNRDQLLQDSVNLLRGERQRLQAQLSELKKAQQDQESSLLSVTGKSVEYNDLKRALETDTAMYNALLARLTEIDVTKGMSDLPAQVYEHAVDATPAGVSSLKIYVAGLALGLAAGLGCAIGLHLLDHSIKTIDQAERIVGASVLAAVPRKSKTDVRELDSAVDRKGFVAEAFRSLRTSLATGVKADKRRTFLFTSAMPSEGKTFCSANFAVSLEQQGFKTLIIDADLRKPMVSRIFFGKRRGPGLIEVLKEEIPLRDAIMPTEWANLSVLTAGGDVPDIAELFASQRWRDVLKEAAFIYDRIVVDSAPILAVSDSLLLAPHVDATCLVIRAFKTPERTVGRAVKALSEVDCQPVGALLNFMPTGTGSYYYYSGRYYGSYGEKSVYGS